MRQLVLIALVWAVFTVESFAQTINPLPYGPNGTVYAIAVKGNTAYLGGNFTKLAFPTGPTALIDSATGQTVRNFARSDGKNAVFNAVESDGTGGWFIGGNFQGFGGAAIKHLVHIKSDYTVDTSWNLKLNSFVYSLARVGDTLFAGGYFDSSAGLPRSKVLAVQISTRKLLPWNPIISGNTVTALMVTDNTVYFGGDFLYVNGIVRYCLASVDRYSAATTGWNPNPTMGNKIISGFGKYKRTIYAVGGFTKIDTATRYGLAAMNDSSGIAFPWNPSGNFAFPAGGYILQTIVVKGAKIYVGGRFSSYNGTTRNNALALDTLGNLLPWNPNLNDQVYTMTADGSSIYLGGIFTTASGNNIPYACAVDTIGNVSSWTPSTDERVLHICAYGGKVLIAGYFGSSGLVSRNNAAAIDLTTGLPTSWNPNLNNWVQSIVHTGNAVAVGGSFTQVAGNKPLSYLVLVDDTLGAVAVTAPAPNGTVYAMSYANGTLYVGGAFGKLGATYQAYLGAINPVSGSVVTWSPKVDYQVNKIASFGNAIYFAGSFDSVNSVYRYGLASVDAVTGTLNPWNPSPNNMVSSLAMSPGAVYVGGNFTQIGATPVSRSHLAAIDPTTGNATSWNPGTIDAQVGAIATSTPMIVVGGWFSTIGSSSRTGLAALDPSSGSVLPWNPGLSQYATVYAVTLSPSAILAGGSFTAAGNISALNFAQYGGVTLTSVESPSAPVMVSSYRLEQNYPNPFNPTTRIAYVIPSGAGSGLQVAGSGKTAGSGLQIVGSERHVQLVIYDVLGREVAVLVDGLQSPGRHEVMFNASRLSSGAYFYRLTAGQYSETKKLMLVR
jgi:hypothetical protein